MKTSLTPFETAYPNMFSDFGREMHGLMNRMFAREDGSGSSEWFNPLANVSETENQYEVTVDLPGIAPDDVNVELKHGDLWITGERKHEAETKKKTFHCAERHYGRFQRVIRLGDDVDPDNVDAEYRDGVLHIAVPKSESAKPTRVTIRK